MKLRLLALSIVTALAMTSLVVVSPAESAPRTWSKMAVSRDGRTWTKKLSGPLFTSSTRLVPGDRVTRSFRVRNQSSERATLMVWVVANDRTGWLRGGTLKLVVRAIGGRWTPVVRSGTTRVLATRVNPGRVRKILVRASLDRRAGNATMRRSLPFKIKLRMTSVRGR